MSSTAAAVVTTTTARTAAVARMAAQQQQQERMSGDVVTVSTVQPKAIRPWDAHANTVISGDRRWVRE